MLVTKTKLTLIKRDFWVDMLACCVEHQAISVVSSSLKAILVFLEGYFFPNKGTVKAKQMEHYAKL